MSKNWTEQPQPKKLNENQNAINEIEREIHYQTKMMILLFLFYEYDAFSINSTEIISIDLELKQNETLVASGEQLRETLELVAKDKREIDLVVENRDRNR